MPIILAVVKWICLAVALWLGQVNILKAFRQDQLKWGTLALQSAALAGFIVLQFCL